MAKLKIDIVSDVMCPWCVIGYNNMASALEQLNDEVQATIEWHAFELNPQMPIEGQNVQQHLMEKYGITAEQSEQNRLNITQRGKDSGFDFNFGDQLWMVNTFDCHRLLTWAKTQGLQTELKLALFDAHFTDNKKLNDNEILVSIAEQVGLSGASARAVLDSDQYAQQVREEQDKMRQMGIQSVPTFIINDKYAISGGQPTDAFVNALKQIALEPTVL